MNIRVDPNALENPNVVNYIWKDKEYKFDLTRILTKEGSCTFPEYDLARELAREEYIKIIEPIDEITKITLIFSFYFKFVGGMFYLEKITAKEEKRIDIHAYLSPSYLANEHDSLYVKNIKNEKFLVNGKSRQIWHVTDQLDDLLEDMISESHKSFILWKEEWYPENKVTWYYHPNHSEEYGKIYLFEDYVDQDDKLCDMRKIRILFKRDRIGEEKRWEELMNNSNSKMKRKTLRKTKN